MWRNTWHKPYTMYTETNRKPLWRKNQTLSLFLIMTKRDYSLRNSSDFQALRCKTEQMQNPLYLIPQNYETSI